MSGGDWKDMYTAADSGDLALVRYHIEAGVDPNYQHPEIMRTPLVTSILQGHVEVAHYLLDHGAAVNLVSDYDSLTPLQAAQRVGAHALVQTLQQRGAKAAVRPPWWHRLLGGLA